VEEDSLTVKQKAWLALSRKIGPLAMTKTERRDLERLYGDMSPEEQETLYEFIREHFGARDDESDDPIARMQKRVWNPPSKKLKEQFARLGASKPPLKSG
jgi:hypothetical protein